MHASIRVAIILGLGGAALPVVASEGKGLFEYFRCAECHGADGRTSDTRQTQKPLAGMSADHVTSVVRSYLARGDHAQVGGALCAEPPSSAQVRQIAEYVSSLPR